MKLALGTVQFGLDYGINNRAGVPSDQSLKAILEQAGLAGITMLDTAAAYGNAEERLGGQAVAQFSIVSKFPNVHSPEELRDYCLRSCEQLGHSTLYGYLAHDAATLIRQPDLWEELELLKQENITLKAGVSLYTPQQLGQLLDLGIVPDLVQLPYSLLDRRFEPFFGQLKATKTEIHTRSAFLQGLYFKNPETLTGKLTALKPALTALREIVRQHGLSMEAVALQFATRHPLVDRVVIGVDSPEQLLSNCNAVLQQPSGQALFDAINAIPIEHSELLNPSLWHV